MNGSAGVIDAKELKVAMRALGFEPKKEVSDMPPGQIGRTFSVWLRFYVVYHTMAFTTRALK